MNAQGLSVKPGRTKTTKKPKLYRVTAFERNPVDLGGAFVLKGECSDGEKWAVSFPNGPDAFVPGNVLLAWLLSGINNLETLFEDANVNAA